MDRPYAGPIGVNLNSTSGPAYGGFLPTQLSGCVLWLRADMGITKDGSDKVSAWADQSGNGNDATQGTGAQQPLWLASAGSNGQPAIEFDGINDNLKATFALGQPCHLFVVVKLKTTPTAGDTLVDGYPTVNAGRLHATGAGPQFSLYSGVNLLGPATDTSWHILEAQSNGASSKLQRDSEGYATGNSGTNNPAGIVLGVASDLATGFTECYFSEVIEFSRILSAGEISNVQAYLANRYAL